MHTCTLTLCDIQRLRWGKKGGVIEWFLFTPTIELRFFNVADDITGDSFPAPASPSSPTSTQHFAILVCFPRLQASCTHTRDLRTSCFPVDFFSICLISCFVLTPFSTFSSHLRCHCLWKVLPDGQDWSQMLYELLFLLL